MKIKLVFIALSVFFQIVAIGQNKPKKAANLVTNGGFEEFEQKELKGAGGVELAKPWMSPFALYADVFSENVKNPKLKCTTNEYGTQKAYEGSSMAGFIAFTKDSKKKFRTYLEIKLSQKLVAGKKYCLSYQISLGELSKEAVNNIGVYVSEKKIQKSGDGGSLTDFTPQVMIHENKVVSNYDSWQKVCGTYTANGNEEYIVIGCFGDEDALEREKVKKPSNVSGTVLNGAYYYIDDISVVEIQAKSECNCISVVAQSADLIYSAVSARPVMATPQDILNTTEVYFANLNSEIPAQFSELMTEVIGLLKSNPTLKIELTGHSDMDEIEEAAINPDAVDIALKRAESVKAAMVTAGINASRISVVSKDASVPHPTSKNVSDLDHAKNRRVIFKVK
jgi:outer membrane protein OmpA-like peptidoglycan-associated protein